MVYYYHDISVPHDKLAELISMDNVKLVDMSNTSIKNPRMWRFNAAIDPDINKYIMRDIDSRISQREKLAVDKWLNSTSTFHIMHDHPGHCGKRMQVGMWSRKYLLPK